MHIQKVDLENSTAAKNFTDSLKETGFAVLTNHPIDNQLVKDVYAEWEEFFHAEQRFDYLFDAQKGHDGYIPSELSETAKDATLKDIKEFYHWYEKGRHPHLLSDKMQQLYSQLNSLATTLLRWIEKYTPAEIAKTFSIPLSEMIKDSEHTLFRILHYPPLTGNEPKGAVRAAEHEDINFITLLPAATAEGLQAKDKDGNWHNIPCDSENIIVNIADMLQLCSQHYYKSTTHRVINPTGNAMKKARLSMPLFLHPRREVRLSAEHTAESYFRERMRELGLD